MKTAYYDTTFLFKVLCIEHDSEKVRVHAAQMHYLTCSLHGRAECIATVHRKFREGIVTREQSNKIFKQLDEDTNLGLIKWLPLSEKQLLHLESVFRQAPKTLFLRAADALHLASAAENGFKEIYSNDRHLLTAAPFFGLKGRNLLID